ncbi:hypothetical protein [Leifsonia sp. Leaf336]|uniref:hypothetical protein n=1 Tax=Leifsonia sp. Leaf336 TaxID=1736341 RepID=UPI000B1FD0B6|nr:hypothetical protein [Leifsonia sp. Leaf336]
MTGPAQAAEDPQAFLLGLIERVRNALPPVFVERVLVVERRRTLSDRVSGRPGAITRISLLGRQETLTLGYEPGPHWAGEAELVYRGATVVSRPLSLGDWLTAFAERVAALESEVAGDAATSSLALQMLGLEPPGSEIRVREAKVDADLRTLPARLRRRLPAEAIAQVGRIGELLVDALDRVEGQGEPEVMVRRTATVYLPDTLRAYLVLPPDWAVRHVLPDGTTPAQTLVAQLGELEAAARRMRDAAAEHDASALLVNGRFLSQRFGLSRLDLP